MQTTILVFTGLPGTGKTTLSRAVADALGITLIAKDDIKEIMFDNIGWSDKAFSAKLARATFGIMEHITDQHLKNGVSIALESNYSPKLANKIFQNWQNKYSCNIVQIVCQTEVDVLARRHLERQQTNRHPGHIDTGSVETYKLKFSERVENGEDQPLDINGPVLVVDTTDFSTVNTQEVTKWVKAHIVK